MPALEQYFHRYELWHLFIIGSSASVCTRAVTGIGFIGAGLIFVRQDRVQGLTTAATVWLVTAIGMACAAGLLLLAVAVTCAYFVVAFVFPFFIRSFTGARTSAEQVNAREPD